MDRKKVILLVAALIVAALTAVMARSMFTGSAAPTVAAAVAPVPTGPKILVAEKALPMGTIITADALSYKPWPKELVGDAYLIEGKSDLTPDKLIGYVVRAPITAGQPISTSALVSPDDRGFLAAVLSPGMRAITVPVSKLTGVAGFVFPGDRVDLFLTQNVDSADGAQLKVSETIVRNLRVLATDQKAAPTKDDKGQTVVSEYSLVTLEATPRLAEQITVAQAMGTISLSLRPLADNAAELEQALASGSVTIPKGATPEEEQRIMSSLTQSPKSGGGTYAAGGDVSRFGRRATGTEVRGVTAIEKAAMTQRTAAYIEKMTAPVEIERINRMKTVEIIRKGPIVRVSEAGSVKEVQLERR
jgi:pilus assembly protein CpaB